MAMDLYKENPSPLGIMSPRISFSHDISPSDIINFPVEQSLLPSISSSSPEFDFCNHNSFNQHSVSAEDIFLDGKLLPTDKPKPKPKPKSKPKPQEPPAPRQPSLNHGHHTVLIPEKKNSESQRSNDTPGCFDNQAEDQKKKSKSFWQFKRSSSLNSGNSYARSLCPIPLLSRSNSAGSATSSKRSSSTKESHNLNKQHAPKSSLVSSSTKQSQKPPLKKNGYGGNTNYGSSSSHGNGVRINPVLNVPSANLFGLGSIFSSSSNKQEKSTKFKL